MREYLMAWVNWTFDVMVGVEFSLGFCILISFCLFLLSLVFPFTLVFCLSPIIIFVLVFAAGMLVGEIKEVKDDER